MDTTLKNMIERWNGADVLLYRHFNETFWRKIKQHGKAFYEDLKEFRRKNLQVQSECISPVEAKERAFRLTKHVRKLQLNPLVSNFDRYFCDKILTDEVEYLKYFRLKFNPYFGYQRRKRLEHSEQFQGTTTPPVHGEPKQQMFLQARNPRPPPTQYIRILPRKRRR